MSNLIVTCHPGDEGDKPKKEEPKVPINIRASIFFDGTDNNRTNTEHRLKNTDVYQSMINPSFSQIALEIAASNGPIPDPSLLKDTTKEYYWRKKGGVGSYGNDKTNIAKLETYMTPKSPSFNFHFPIYIEGIGTNDHESDTLVGLATGRGETGIISKVEKGIANIVANINTISNNDKLITTLRLDAFGFSRGAAAARYFIYAALQAKNNIKELLKSDKWTVSNVEMCFVGLYDTVSALGITVTDDTKALHLDAITNAKTVVHLCASDEFREHFPLTDISAKPGGTEIFLPGAHSDIGGGYNPVMDEVDLKVLKIKQFIPLTKARERFRKDIDWFVNGGWYTREQINELSDHVVLTRTGISNEYNKIPLFVMKNHAANETLQFDLDIDIKEAVPGAFKDLHELKNIIGIYGKGDWKKDVPLLRRIRNKFCHFSSFYDDTLGKSDPRFVPDLMTGVRKRQVFPVRKT